MFGPLSFPSSSKATKLTISFDDLENNTTKCILCDIIYDLPNQQNELLTHIFEVHRLVIADVPFIASLSKYISYWKVRFTNGDLKDFCSTVIVDVEKDGKVLKDQEYYLLSDVLPEDKQLRDGLQMKRLEWVIEQQMKEREDNKFTKGCLFCRLQITGTRAEYITHLSTKHNLQLGRPQNLVFIDKLIDKIEQKLESLQCIYCEKVFKDRNVLKEHMRKKLHKRINPDNKDYDHFYIVNYIEMGKNWKDKHTPMRPLSRRESSGSDDAADWSDWKDEAEVAIVCLFCNHSVSSWSDIMEHMTTEHSFSYEANTAHLDFYQQVKLVNYIRRQIYCCQCITCSAEFATRDDLMQHMKQEKHLTMPSQDLWNQPEYFFPTYENDAFLCQLDDSRYTEQDLCDSLSSSFIEENTETFKALQEAFSDSDCG